MPALAFIPLALVADCAADPGLAVLFGATRPISSTWATELYRRAHNRGLRVTVYPSISGGFPPATFWVPGESYRYIREMQIQGAPCGLCECPAGSYDKHFPDTVRAK